MEKESFEPIVCDAWQVRRQTYTLPACAGTKLILLGDRDARVCERLAQGCTPRLGGRDTHPRLVDRKSITLTTRPPNHTQDEVEWKS